ncbi:hypothetical protein [Streptomyces chartreusis]
MLRRNPGLDLQQAGATWFVLCEALTHGLDLALRTCRQCQAVAAGTASVIKRCLTSCLDPLLVGDGAVSGTVVS